MDNEKIKENLAHNCKAIRAEEKLSQNEFAKKVGTNRAAYAKIEEGKATNFATIVQIAALGNISLDEMIKTKIEIDGKGN